MKDSVRTLLNGVRGILTHGGNMHMDDFLSVALALQLIDRNRLDKGQIYLRRGVPEPGELADPSVLVFDIGMLHEPERLNFDHHGLDYTTSSFRLFLEAIDLWEKFAMAHPWADRIASIDHNGPRVWAWESGVPEAILPSLISPVEAAVKALGSGGFESPGMLDILDLVGKHCINEVLGMEKAMMDIERREKELVTPGGLRGVLYEGSVKKSCFPAAFNYLAKKKGWHFSVTHDDRGIGWAIFRFDNCIKLDFKRLEGRPDILFTHRSGFLAKTKNRDVDLSDLIEKASG